MQELLMRHLGAEKAKTATTKQLTGSAVTENILWAIYVIIIFLVATSKKGNNFKILFSPVYPRCSHLNIIYAKYVSGAYHILISILPVLIQYVFYTDSTSLCLTDFMGLVAMCG